MIEPQGGISQKTIINGSPQQINNLILLLCAACVIGGANLVLQFVNRDDMDNLSKEVRILQIHTQDQNAILIRSGLLKPGDLTAGPTNPTQLETP
jgi:hypothetical protein